MSLWRRIFTERRAIALPLTIFLGANILVAALIVFPMERSVAGLKDAELDAAAARGQAMKLEMNAKASQAGKERAEADLEKFYRNVLPSSSQAASQLTYSWLDRVAKESGVDLNRGTGKVEDIRDSRLKRWSANAKLVGDYTNIRKFLYDVETAEEFVIIEEVGLSQFESVRGGDLLELELKLTTYFVPRTSAGALAK
jgi:Tfp pilus assembly protein PilO